MNYTPPRKPSRFTQQALVGATICIPLVLTVLLLGLFTGGDASAQGLPESKLHDSLDIDHETWVVRIPFTEQKVVDRLATELDVWSVDHERKFVIALVDAVDRSFLEKQGVTFELDPVRMGALQALAQSQNRSVNAVLGASSPFSPTTGIPGHACYRTVEETYASLDTLANDYPNLAQVVDIGDSWNKINDNGSSGYDLRALVLTNQQNQFEKPVFFLVAAVHARELTTSELATRFGEMLASQYGTDPNVTWLLDYNEVHIVPVANPDGRKEAEKLIYWRKNRNLVDGACDGFVSATRHGGVDLNRNSSFKWNICAANESCSSNNFCSQTYRGTGASSEPETQALEQYMSGIFSDTRPISDTAPASLETAGVMITLHSYGRLVLFPWGWSTEPAPNDAGLATLGRKFGHFTGYEVCQSGAPGCIYRTDGTTDDWAYGELGVAAYTFELGTSFFEQCSYFENTLVEKNMNALLYATKAARLPYQLPSGPEIVSVDITTPTMTSAEFMLTATADDTLYSANGSWGIEPTQNISAARYSIDQPSWISDTEVFPMTVQDGIIDSGSETFQTRVDTGCWQPRQYKVFVEAQDAEGNWGVPSATDVTIERNEFEARVQIDTEPRVVMFGESTKYSLGIENIGLAADTYTLTITSTWPVDLVQQTAALSECQKAEIEFTVQVPPTTTKDLSTLNEVQKSIEILVESSGAEQVLSRIDLNVAASPFRRYFPFIGWD